MEKGGVVNICIAVVCFVVIYIGLSKMFFYCGFRRSRQTMNKFLAGKEVSLSDKEIKRDWLLQVFFTEYKQHTNRSVKYYTNFFREMLLEKVPHFEEGLDTMAAWISVAPLLGLLGTVVGMVKTFSIITVFGVGNPNLLSEGISVALLTTQSGLIVAFPCLLFHNYLVSRKTFLVKEIVADSEKLLHWVEEKGV